MLAVASRETKDALRMVHVPSFKTFANWPTAGTPLKCAPIVMLGIGPAVRVKDRLCFNGPMMLSFESELSRLFCFWPF